MENQNKNNGSAKKRNPSSAGFVGKKETPVDFSEALLQGKKFRDMVDGALKAAKSGITEIGKISSKTISDMRSQFDITPEVRKMESELTKSAKRVSVERQKLDKRGYVEKQKLSQKEYNEWLKDCDRRRKFEKQMNELSSKSVSKKHKKLLDDARKQEKLIRDLEKKVEDAKANRSTSYESYANQLDSARSDFDKTINDYNKAADKRTEIANKAMGVLKDALISVGDMIVSTFTGGIDKYSAAYESTFTDIASRDNNDTRSGTRGIYKDMINAINDSGLSGAINISEDAIPALAETYKQGFIGEEALAKATSDATAKVLMPWLDTASEAWVNLSANLNEAQMNNLKGMQLQLKESQSGNRLLQSGVIGSLTDELAPLLTNIEYNTGGTDMAAEYEAIMKQMLDQGYSENDAYAAVKKLMDADKNQYKALTEGDAATRMYAMNRVQGKDTISSMEASYGELNKQAAATGSDLGASAFLSNLGGSLSDWHTQDKAKQAGNIDFDKASKTASDLKNQDKNQRFYNKALGSIDENVTATKEAQNSIENAAAEASHWATAIPGGAKWFSSVISSLWSILAAIIANASMDKIKDLFSKFKDKGGLKNLGKTVKDFGSKAGKVMKDFGSKAGKTMKSFGSKAGPALKNFASKAGQVLGKSGVGSKATSALGAAGLVAGAAMMIKDGVAASKKAKKWGVSKGSAGVAGAVFGSSDVGLKDAFKKGASKEDKKAAVKNTLGQTAKGAAIGAGIGSFIPGVGTAIGGAVGGAVGLVSSIFSGKEVAQGLEKIKKGITGAFSKIGDSAKEKLGKAKEALSNLKDKVSSGLSKLGDKAKEALSNAKDKIKDKVGNIKDKVKGFFSHASGLDHVPYDGYKAKLHKGEAVLTANQNRLMKSNSGLFSMMTRNNTGLKKLLSDKGKIAGTIAGGMIGGLPGAIIGNLIGRKKKADKDGEEGKAQKGGLLSKIKDFAKSKTVKGAVAGGLVGGLPGALLGGIIGKKKDKDAEEGKSGGLLDKIKGKAEEALNGKRSKIGTIAGGLVGGIPGAILGNIIGKKRDEAKNKDGKDGKEGNFFTRLKDKFSKKDKPVEEDPSKDKEGSLLSKLKDKILAKKNEDNPENALKGKEKAGSILTKLKDKLFKKKDNPEDQNTIKGEIKNLSDVKDKFGEGKGGKLREIIDKMKANIKDKGEKISEHLKNRKPKTLLGKLMEFIKNKKSEEEAALKDKNAEVEANAKDEKSVEALEKEGAVDKDKLKGSTKEMENKQKPKGLFGKLSEFLKDKKAGIGGALAGGLMGGIPGALMGGFMGDKLSGLFGKKDKPKGIFGKLSEFLKENGPGIAGVGGALAGGIMGGIPGAIAGGVMGKKSAEAMAGIDPLGNIIGKAKDAFKGKREEGGEDKPEDDKSKSNKEIIDAMRSCTSMIVQAINGNGSAKGEDQRSMRERIKDGLLPASSLKGAEKNDDMIGLYPSVPSNSSVV